MAKQLLEICFDYMLKDLESFQDYNLSETLPVDLKERLFSYYTSSISNEPSSSPFPITSYPEDRYRDVQLVNRITCQRVIPLCFAMWSSLDYKYEKVRKLIEEDACDVNENDLEGFCPLHYAAIYGRIDACKLLLIHGADCSRKNNFGKTPADLAQDVKVQQMIKLRALLFRKDEVKEMEQDLQVKRKQIAEFQRKQLREEFLKQSQHISNVLVKKGYDSKSIQSPLSVKHNNNYSSPCQSHTHKTQNINNNNSLKKEFSVNNQNFNFIHHEENEQKKDNSLRSFIAQIDLPTNNSNLPQQRDTLPNNLSSSIGIPRSRQSNSTIVPHLWESITTSSPNLNDNNTNIAGTGQEESSEEIQIISPNSPNGSLDSTLNNDVYFK